MLTSPLTQIHKITNYLMEIPSICLKFSSTTTSTETWHYKLDYNHNVWLMLQYGLESIPKHSQNFKSLSTIIWHPLLPFSLLAQHHHELIFYTTSWITYISSPMLSSLWAFFFFLVYLHTWTFCFFLQTVEHWCPYKRNPSTKIHGCHLLYLLVL